MPKRRKKEIHMIDISGRFNLKITSATSEEIEFLEQELKDIELSVEERMRKYEVELQQLMLDAITDDIITTTEQDSLYFIETYEELFRNRNMDNIKNRLEQYRMFLKEL